MVEVHCIGGCGKVMYSDYSTEPKTYMCKDCLNKIFAKEIKDIKKEEKHVTKKSKT